MAAIASALEPAGSDRTALRPADLAPVDEFHIRGRAASLEIVEALGLTAGSHVVGDATATRLPDAAFDAALTVHVAMNVSDKPALYAEAFRVLRPGGRFVAYDVLQGEGGDVRYPVPWAADSSEESLMWFQQMRARIERDGPPPVTFAAFLGDAFATMAANQVANLAERRIRTVMFTCLRPL